MKYKSPTIKKEKGGFRAKRALGQHFITDESLLEDLVDLSGITKDDAVFEIGPGLGHMTAILAKKAKAVLALEIDPQLIPILNVTLHGLSCVQVIQGDIMTVDLVKLLTPMGPFKIVANLPYYITTPILNLLLHADLPILSINVMVQKEAAERLVAGPSTPSYGPLAILAQYKAEPKIQRHIEAALFSPPPKCASAFVVMPMREKPPVDVQEDIFFKLVNASFAMRRKTLLNNLMPAFGLSRQSAQSLLQSAGLLPDIRGEALSMGEFAALSNLIASPNL